MTSSTTTADQIVRSSMIGSRLLFSVVIHAAVTMT